MTSLGTSKKQQTAARQHRADLMKSYTKKSLTGGFSDIGYITTGPTKEQTDDYVKQEQIPSRYLGKNMMVRAPRSGNLPDVYFDKLYATLASSTQGGPGADKYEPPKNRFRDGEVERKKIQDAIQKVHKGSDFKMSNYPSPTTGPGSYTGCFQDKPFEHMPADKNILKRGEPAKMIKEFPPRNFMTNPAPKGSYGVPNTTFGKFNSLYVLTPEMQEQRKKEVEKWEKKKAQFEASKKALLERPVFSGMSTAKNTFDEKKATGATSVFDEFVPTPEQLKVAEKEAKIRAKAQKRKERAEAKKNKGRKIVPLPEFMVYSSGPKSGEQGFFNKFPDQAVVPDQTVLKKREERAEKKAKAEAKASKKKGGKQKIEHPEWKPVSGAKSSCTSSLLPRYY